MNAFIGTIIQFAGNYVPQNWMPCSGATLDIKNHEALFSVLGTNYGGDGVHNFKLPDMPSPQYGPLWIICVQGEYPMRG